MRREFYRADLKVEQPVSENLRNAKLGLTVPRFLGKVVGDFQIDVIGGDPFFARPALLDDVGQLVGNIDAPTISPSRIEPVGEFLTGIMVHHIDVKLSLHGQARKGQVAAPHKPDFRIYRVRPVQQIQFCVQRVAQEKFNDHLSRPNLTRQPAQPRLIGIIRHAKRELGAEFVSKGFL